MSGVASRLWVRMTRSRAEGWGAAATSGLWQRRTVETQTAALNPHPKSRPGEPATWKPLSPPSPRWPHSSESGNVLACGFCCREITWEIKYCAVCVRLVCRCMHLPIRLKFQWSVIFSGVILNMVFYRRFTHSASLSAVGMCLWRQSSPVLKSTSVHTQMHTYLLGAISYKIPSCPETLTTTVKSFHSPLY